MRKSDFFFEKGTVPQFALIASALIGLLAITGFSRMPEQGDLVSDMRIEPNERVVTENDEFEIALVVESFVPVNAFAGELRFDTNVLKVTSIDYNTSIADLWAELPWFSNGDGTLNFAGGSTRPGGFLGAGTLITVTFQALGEGTGVISIHEPRILLHDGFGTDSEVKAPVDALFTITEGNLLSHSPVGTTYRVTTKIPSTDLNDDGKQSVADISIFMLHIGRYNERYDFNVDGGVNLKDLNIILGAK